MRPIPQTASILAAVRAEESHRPDPLFTDFLAPVLVGPHGGLSDAAALAPATSAGIVVRTRWIDDRLQKACQADGITQVVLLGAGLDTRAYRLGLPEDVVVYEVDRPELLQSKAARLAGAGRPTARRVLVPADLSKPWGSALNAGGFSPDAPTAWVLEDVLAYLRPIDVALLLDELTSLTAPGSQLLADVVTSAALTHPGTRAWRRTLEELGEPWLFGTDDPLALLGTYGWVGTASVLGEDGTSYGRLGAAAADHETEARWPHTALVAALHR